MATKQELQDKLLDIQEKYSALITKSEEQQTLINTLEEEKTSWNDEKISLNDDITRLQERNRELFLNTSQTVGTVINQPIKRDVEYHKSLDEILGNENGESGYYTDKNTGERVTSENMYYTPNDVMINNPMMWDMGQGTPQEPQEHYDSLDSLLSPGGDWFAE